MRFHLAPFAAAALLLAAACDSPSGPQPGGAAVWITILRPTGGQVVGDTVTVVARVDSAKASVSAVEAVYGGRTTPLVSVGGASPAAVLDLAGLPLGDVAIRVRATTVQGDTGAATVTVVHGGPVGLTITAPLPGTVARPSVRVDADCGGCASMRVTARIPPDTAEATVATGTHGIHADVSLAAYDGVHRLLLTVTGVDGSGVVSRRVMEIPVESSTRLTPLVSGGERLMAFDATRLLVGSEDFDASKPRSWSVRVVDRGTGAATEILSSPFGQYDTTFVSYEGWPHTGGFAFKVRNHYHDWRPGQDPVVLPGAGFHVSFAGDWAGLLTGESPSSVVRRNLATGAEEALGTTFAIATSPEVAANGDIVWRGGDGNVWRAHVGQAPEKIADVATPSRNASWPVTDGVNVAYLVIEANVPQKLRLYTADGTMVELGEVAPFETTYPVTSYPAHAAYETRNGWTAFLRPDAGALRQVWTRSPAGELRQATFVGNSAAIRELGPSGEVIFASGGSVYAVRAPYTSAPVRLFSDSPDYFLRWYGGQLVFFLGRTAFTVSY